MTLPPILALLFHWRALIEISDAATTNRFPAIRRYKAQLNQAIAQAAALLAVALVISALLDGATRAAALPEEGAAAIPARSDDAPAPATRGGLV